MADTSPGRRSLEQPQRDDRAVVPVAAGAVPLLTEKDDKEVQWHAKHGIVLMLAELWCG